MRKRVQSLLAGAFTVDQSSVRYDYMILLTLLAVMRPHNMDAQAGSGVSIMRSPRCFRLRSRRILSYNVRWRPLLLRFPSRRRGRVTTLAFPKVVP